MRDKFIRMTTEPVRSLVLKMAAPTTAMMLVSAVYNIADTYFVGRLGTSATAAIGVSFSLMALIQAIGFLFGHGAGNYISRELGAKRRDNADKMAATGFLTTLIVGAALALPGLAFLRPLAIALGSTPTILPHAMDYLFFILIAAPWMAASFALNNLLRFQGSAVYGMLGMASGAVLNLMLDPLFIFVFDMGVGGAGLATMISQMAGFSLLLYGCTRPGNIRIRLGNFAPSRGAYKEIMAGGFPSLCRQGLASIAAIVLNHAAAAFGDAAVAAIAIVQRIGMFAGSALIGFGQGFQPVCGFNFGAGLYSRVREAFYFCVRSASVALLVIAACGYVYAAEIVALFRDGDPAVIEIGTLALRFECFTFPLMGWVILNNMMLQTIGRAVRASVLALARQGLFLMPVLFLLTPGFGILGIQLAQPFANFATFLLSLPLGIGVLREMKEQDAGKANLDESALEEQAAAWEA
ncbi:MAG: MATE family efflux transporter [Planctomycetota bacterium]|jgi:putative MATE family efflux protein|nr:MATE family efflux transporter [Planctomycetota bacterium]